MMKEKLKALQAAMEKIEKSYGKGSIMKMGDDSVEQVEVIPTGSIALNVALGDVYKRQPYQCIGWHYRIHAAVTSAHCRHRCKPLGLSLNGIG